MSRIILTAKWIRDSSIFSSIKPKNEKRLFVYFCFFHILTYLAPKNIKAKQVRTGKNKQLVTIFWLNLRKYCSVSYSLNCSWYFRYYLIHLKHSPTLSREDLFFCITEHVHSQKLNSLFGRTSFSFFREKNPGYLPGDGLMVNVNHDDLEVLVSGVLSNPVRTQNSQTKHTTSNTFLQRKKS